MGKTYNKLMDMAENRYGRRLDENARRLLTQWLYSDLKDKRVICAMLDCNPSNLKALIIRLRILSTKPLVYSKRAVGLLPVKEAGFESEKEYFLARLDYTYLDMSRELGVNIKKVYRRYNHFKEKYLSILMNTEKRRE